MLTACGIETLKQLVFWPCCHRGLQQCLPLAVLKPESTRLFHFLSAVATVLTACGIETCRKAREVYYDYRLQQCLPLAVLKLLATKMAAILDKLQQCLPLAVLKPSLMSKVTSPPRLAVATVLTACGIETDAVELAF